jgi:hypothetical protein
MSALFSNRKSTIFLCPLSQAWCSGDGSYKKNLRARKKKEEERGGEERKR